MYIYMLYCRPNTIYTGIAKDAAHRIYLHLSHAKQAAAYTKSHPPYGLAALWTCDSKSLALKAEAYIKSLSRSSKDALIQKPSLLQEAFSKEDVTLISQKEMNEIWTCAKAKAETKLDASFE